MGTRKKAAVIVTASVLVAGGAASIAAASSDDDHNVTGRDADRATEAALHYTGGGHANSVERDSEDGATWEVEVRKTDGSQVDVRLDQRFQLVVIDADSEGG